MKKYHEIITKIGEELDINVTLLSDGWGVLLEKDNQKHYLWGYQFDANGHGLGKIIDDKGMFYDLLVYLNIPIIEHYVLLGKYDKEDVLKYFNDHNKEIIVKGSLGNSGIHVFKVDNEKDLFNILDEEFKVQYTVCLCPYYHIKNEYRVIILNNEVKVFFGKIKPTVIGNGIDTVRDLTKKCYEYYLTHEDEINNPDYIPKLNEEVEVNYKFNLTSGGKTFMDINSKLKKEICDLAIRVTKEVGITFASVDIIHTMDNELLVMEANSGVKMDNFINQNEEGYNIAYNIYKDAVKLMFND